MVTIEVYKSDFEKPSDFRKFISKMEQYVRLKGAVIYSRREIQRIGKAKMYGAGTRIQYDIPETGTQYICGNREEVLTKIEQDKIDHETGMNDIFIGRAKADIGAGMTGPVTINVEHWGKSSNEWFLPKDAINKAYKEKLNKWFDDMNSKPKRS